MTTVKRFSEMNIHVEGDRKIFECEQVSITEIVNCEIVVIDYLDDIKTRHGEGRYLVMFSRNGKEAKFFTNSKSIKCTLEAIPKSDFPFASVIKCVKCGQNSIYKFT